MKNNTRSFVTLLGLIAALFFGVLATPAPASAAVCQCSPTRISVASCDDCASGCAALSPAESRTECTEDSETKSETKDEGDKKSGLPPPLTNPLGTTDIPTIIGRVIQAFLGISGSIGLVMFIYGGVVLLTSAGNPEKIQKGKNVIVWATLGLVLIFGAYALVNFVLSAILR